MSKCLVCNNERDDEEYSMCPVCGAWGDWVTGKDGVTYSGANTANLEECKKMYAAGRLDMIRRGKEFDENALRLDEKDGMMRAIYKMPMYCIEYIVSISKDKDFDRKLHSDGEILNLYSIMKNMRHDGDDAVRMDSMKVIEEFM